MRFDGRAVVVFGGASGIGRAAAIAFAAEGASVIVADLDADGASSVAVAIADLGGTAEGVATDVSAYEDVMAATSLARTRYGRLDVVFNCAGIAVHRPLLEHEPDDFQRVVRVNQQGTFHGILAAARTMRELHSPGCIINTASVLADLATSGFMGYHASKGAVRAMTQAAALELAPLGIRVVAIAPGFVDTPLVSWIQALGLEREVARRQMRRRIISAERVADVVLFLATPEADAINGTVVHVDDGYSAFK